MVLVLAFEGRAFALPGDPTPSVGPTATPRADQVNLAGHWETNDFGGMDLVQQGTSVSGMSPAGVSFNGTLAGRRVSFTFWHGASYAAAKEENRGHGSMTLSADGRTLAITWATEEKPSPYNGSFTAIRVGPQIPLGPTGSQPTAAPSPAASTRPTLDQLWGSLQGMGRWQAIFFGASVPEVLGWWEPGGGSDLMWATVGFSYGLAMLSMGLTHGPDWVKDYGSYYDEFMATYLSIYEGMKVPFGGPEATQPPWWSPMTDPDFPWDVIFPPQTASPFQNPPSSGNPLQNPSPAP